MGCAQCDQAENRYEQTADDQTQTIDRIRDCDCLQAAEDCVNGTCERGCDTDCSDCPETSGASVHAELRNKDLIDAEDVNEYLCAGVQNVRQHDDDVREQYNEGNQTAGACIIALLEELRNGGQTGLEVLRHQYECQDNQRDGRGNFPAHRAHADSYSLAVIADQLLCGQVGHEQRTCDYRAGQSATCQIITILRVQIVTSGLPPGDDSDKRGEGHECHSCEHKIHTFILFLHTLSRRARRPVRSF